MPTQARIWSHAKKPQRSLMLKQLILDFIESLKTAEIEVYNEFSLQHELGIFLRDRLPEKKVEFERNVSHFGISKEGLHKKEIDLSISDRNSKKQVCAIELKYPRNGRVPESMFDICKDIAFVEQLNQNGFSTGFVLALCEDSKFFSGKIASPIYEYFRSNKPLKGEVQ
jgi:hypothetical protein